MQGCAECPRKANRISGRKVMKQGKQSKRGGELAHIKIHAEQINLRVRLYKEKSPIMSQRNTKLQDRDLIDNFSAQKGAKQVKKLPRRPSNFPEGGIFKGQAP